jgi:uncharacterized protein YndB with AHSA1/START domain
MRRDRARQVLAGRDTWVGHGQSQGNSHDRITGRYRVASADRQASKTMPRSTKEYEMASNAGAGPRLLGTLGTAADKGVVSVADRFHADIETVWSAITDPSRLASWWGEVEGDLRLGGEYHARVFASGWDGTGRVAACEAPRRLKVLTREPDQPDEQSIEVTLTSDGDETTLVWEERGMPVAYLAGYGAGIQVHVEDLGAYLAGRERCDAAARMAELFPAYEPLAAKVS